LASTVLKKLSSPDLGSIELEETRFSNADAGGARVTKNRDVT